MPNERAITIPSGEANLEGVLLLPDSAIDGAAGVAAPLPAVVICHPHPQYGGSMDNNVVFGAATGVLEHGIAALLFNFRGVGGSDGVVSDRDEARLDALAALDFAAQLPEVDAERVALAGYSFGAGAAAAAARASIPALALISLPLTMLERARDVLEAFPGPLLLLSGDRDQGSEEAGLRELAAASLGAADVQMVAGVDHFWGGRERAVADAIGPFFANALAG
ncbi:MAG: hypothetical protein O2895_06080 [Chloroflexi bacterium]|nr:hypothetical protein [Chloroflexota bacterium]